MVVQVRGGSGPWWFRSVVVQVRGGSGPWWFRSGVVQVCGGSRPRLFTSVVQELHSKHGRSLPTMPVNCQTVAEKDLHGFTTNNKEMFPSS